MKTSEKGIALLKRFEGLSLKAVRLKGERHYTIGYGHYGADVAANQIITEAEATRILRKDLLYFETQVESIVKFPIDQNQFDALVSFTYNLGPGNLWRLTNNRTAAEAAEHWMAYTASGSEDYREGLKKRREEELELFLTPYEEEENEVRYARLSDIPNEYGFRDIIEKLMEAKIINGDGSDPYGNNDVIDLSHDQVRSLIFEYRGGAFDRKLIEQGMEPAVEV